jgi:hypothetical protein
MGMPSAVLWAATRADFVSLVQAFTKFNGPVELPASMGACIVCGYVNWHRVALLRASRADNAVALSPKHSPQTHAAPRKDNYLDCFAILSNGPYSGIQGASLNLRTTSGLRTSLFIRREHEAAHYWTRRALSSMRTHIFDEIVADYCEMLAGSRRFEPVWLGTFFRLGNYPAYRPSGRPGNYWASLFRRRPS